MILFWAEGYCFKLSNKFPLCGKYFVENQVTAEKKSPVSESSPLPASPSKGLSGSEGSLLVSQKKVNMGSLDFEKLKKGICTSIGWRRWIRERDLSRAISQSPWDSGPSSPRKVSLWSPITHCQTPPAGLCPFCLFQIHRYTRQHQKVSVSSLSGKSSL